MASRPVRVNRSIAGVPATPRAFSPSGCWFRPPASFLPAAARDAHVGPQRRRRLARRRVEGNYASIVNQLMEMATTREPARSAGWRCRRRESSRRERRRARCSGRRGLNPRRPRLAALQAAPALHRHRPGLGVRLRRQLYRYRNRCCACGQRPDTRAFMSELPGRAYRLDPSPGTASETFCAKSCLRPTRTACVSHRAVVSGQSRGHN